MNYKKYILSKGGEELGITWDDIKKHILTPAQFEKFEKWMSGQTCGCVDDACKLSVVYMSDLESFMKGRDSLD